MFTSSPASPSPTSWHYIIEDLLPKILPHWLEIEILPALPVRLDLVRGHRSLTSVSQSAISEPEFTNHYQSINAEMLLSDIRWEFLSVLANETKAQVLYRITLTSGLVNSVTRDTGMALNLENGEWRVQWDDAMILPELVGENYLYMEQEGYTPTRPNIYDRYAHALVAQTDAVAVGLYPDQINPEQADQLLTELENLTGLSKEKIRSLYANVPQGSGWYIPVAEVPAEKANEFTEALSGFSGLVLEPYRACARESSLGTHRG